MIGAGVLVVVALALFGGVIGVQQRVLMQAIVTGLLLGGVYSLVAMGLALIFGVLDIINFAHGALMALAMYLTFSLVTGGGFNPYLSILVTIPALFALGVGIQRFLMDRVMGQPHENLLLLTLGLSLIVENALLMGYSSTPRTIEVGFLAQYLPFDYSIFGAVATLPRIIAFVGSIAVAGILYLLLRRTKLGTAIRAVAENPDGAAMVGINVRRIHALTFGLGTACVGAAGTLLMPFLSLQPTTGESYTIIAFVVVVLGGLGSVTGAFVGGIFIGLVQEVGGVLVPGVDKLLIVFVVFVLVLLFRPQGIFGGKT